METPKMNQQTVNKHSSLIQRVRTEDRQLDINKSQDSKTYPPEENTSIKFKCIKEIQNLL